MEADICLQESLSNRLFTLNLTSLSFSKRLWKFFENNLDLFAFFVSVCPPAMALLGEFTQLPDLTVIAKKWEMKVFGSQDVIKNYTIRYCHKITTAESDDPVR